MPVITIELGAGQTNEVQKQELIHRLTSDAVEITGIAAERFTMFINEFPFENIGVGGKTVKESRAGR